VLPRLRRQRNRVRNRSHRAFLLAVFCTILAVGSGIVVLKMPIAPKAKAYLLRTSPFAFSVAELEKQLGQNAPDRLVEFLTGLYWSPGVLLLIMLPLGAISIRRRSGLSDAQEAFLDIADLREALQTYLDEPDPHTLSRLHRLAHQHRPFSRALPVEPDWYTARERLWLRNVVNESRLRAITIALQRFPQALHASILAQRDLGICLPPVQELFNFYSSACSPTAESRDYGMQYLKRFARLARLPILSVARHRRQRTTNSRIRSYVVGIIHQPLVRGAAGISAVAGLVMLVGVLVFKISGAQAFLTWFTVTFGSLTVSVGVTSFRLARNDGPKTPPNAG